MDAAIRFLLAKAEQAKHKESLEEAFLKLKSGRTSNDQTDPFSSDLFVICAEVAFKLDDFQIVEQCMKLFFQKTPPTNQFLCRAYLCQAQLCAPSTSEEKVKLQQCVGYLMKAINFGKSTKRYYFLVFNASVLYWSFVRPFMKPNHRYILAKSFHLVVKALDETNDPEIEWRAQLMVSLMECHIDAGRRDDALHVGQAAMQFMKSNVPRKCKDVFLLQLQHKLLEPAKIQGLIKASPELTFAYRIHKIKMNQELTSCVSEMEKLYKAIVTGEESSGSRALPLTAIERNSLLLDLTRVCLDREQPHLASQCISTLKKMSSLDEKQFCLLEFHACELMVIKLKEKRENYTKLSIETRIDAVNILYEHLLNAKRMQDEDVIQIGCVTLWNLCLPLLQKNLRMKIHRHLLLAANLLEEIDSLLLLLRCQIHSEIAKCEEHRGQLQVAISHYLKAISLDDSGTYNNRLDHSLKRVKLKSLLYEEPERAEDHAAMILEQAESFSDDPNAANIQVYLLKAGVLLAPDSFALAMDGESLLKESKASQCSVEVLMKRVRAFANGMMKIEGHLKHLDEVDKHERIKLWADLVKTARKQNVWDVTRVASRFCLLYEDEFKTPLDLVPPKQERKLSSSTPTSIHVAGIVQGVISREELVGMEKFSDNEDIVRLFAEVNFIYAESLVQLLQTEGMKLLEKPIAPKDTKLRPKKYQDHPILIGETEEWKVYAEWIDKITKETIYRFQTGCNHGASLNDALVVCNAAIFVWNYTKHFIEKKDYQMLTQHYLPLFNNMRRVGHGTETVFFCDFSHALAQGFIKPHIPIRRTLLTPVTHQRRSGKGAKPSNAAMNKGKTGTIASMITSEATHDLQQAMDILEYALGITSDDVAVPIGVRHQLVKAHVLCKGLSNQQYPKNFMTDGDNMAPRAAMTRALYALEIYSLQCEKIVEVSSTLTANDVIQKIESVTWSDTLLHMQLWTRLAVICLNNEDHEIAMRCSNTALSLESCTDEESSGRKHKEKSAHNIMVEQELLFYACVAKAQCLIAEMSGRSEIRREALECFVKACKFASNAQNYDLVMCACRHYWHTIYPLLSIPIERQVLTEPIKTMLGYVNKISRNVFYEKADAVAKKVQAEVETVKLVEEQSTTSPVSVSLSRSRKNQRENSGISTGVVNNTDDKEKKLDDDLKLRAALYGVLFQTYADKGELEDCVVAMNEAVQVLPRTHHRLIIFKHRVIILAKLNKPVQFDMGKFRDESKTLLSQMWHRVASNSKNESDQLSAYMNAIEVLSDDDHIYQKVEYMTDFSEWLFVNEYPRQKAVDQLSYAIYLLANHGGSVLASEESLNNTETECLKNEISQLEALKDIKQMDVLIRLYVMLSEMIGCQDELYEYYNLAAAALVKHMWKTALSNVEKSFRSGMKPGEIESTKAKKLSKSHSKILDRAASENKLPSTIASWAEYRVPDKYREYFKADRNGSYLSNASIDKPMLTMYYLEKLFDNLCGLGFHHLTVHVLSLMLVIAEDLICNSTLTTFVHTMFCNLCKQLNMTSAYNYHQDEILERVEITEREQAESREEIEKWKEKQRRVTVEEERQHSKTRFVKSFNCFQKFQQEKPVILSGCIKRKVWVRIAEYLIDSSRYELAHVFLQEAELSAAAFDDEEISETVRYNCAVIAYRKAQWGMVIEILECGKHHSQLFCVKRIDLLIDALHKFSMQHSTHQSQNNDAGFKKAKTFLENALKSIEVFMNDQPNAAWKGGYLKARFLSRLAMLYYVESKETCHEFLKSRIDLCHHACDWMTESYKLLNRLGYKIESVKTGCNLIEIQLLIVKSDFATERQKSNLINSLELATNLVETMSCHVTHVTNLIPEEESGNVFLPVQLVLMDARNCFVDVMLEVIRIEIAEKKEERIKNEHKTTIQKVIDKYVEVGSNLTPLEEKWENVVKELPQHALALVSSCKPLTHDKPQLVANVSLKIGTLLGLLSRYNCADRYASWYFTEQQTSQDDLTKSGIPLAPSTHSEEDIKNVVELENFKLLQCENFHSLSQALYVALHHSLTNIICETAYRMLDCVGQYDPYVAVQLLALYQSAHASLQFNSMLKRMFIDLDSCASASLFAQYERLKTTSNPCPKVMDKLMVDLSEFEWWKRLSVSRFHFDFIKDIPFNITYVVLQHSPDKKYLYAGVLEKVQPATAGKSRKTGRTSILRVETSARILRDVTEMLSEFQSVVRCELLKKISQGQQRDRRKSLFEVDQSHHQEIEKQTKEADKVSEKIKELFETLITALEAYMGPLLSMLEKSLLIDPIPETVMILADESLLQFPLECLSIFQRSEIQSLCRDFSLQMFYNRVTRGEGESSRQSKPEGKSTKGKLDKQDKSAKVEKVEKKLSAGKSKGAAAVAGDKKSSRKEFVIEKENIQLDLTNLQYVIDPRLDRKENELKGIFETLVATHKPKTNKWSGLKGFEEIPDVKSLQALLHSSSSFLFCGYERLLATLPPFCVLPLNLSDCFFVLLLDMVQTGSSNQRQGKLDVMKSPSDLKLENPLHTAMILSLCGVSTIALNQWYTGCDENKQRVHSLFKGLFDNCLSVSQAARSLHNLPILIPTAPETETTHEEESDDKGRHGKKRKAANSKKPDEPDGGGKNQAKSSRAQRRNSREKLEQSKHPPVPQNEVVIEVTGAADGDDNVVKQKIFYEHYNMVVYGLPNFVTI